MNIISCAGKNKAKEGKRKARQLKPKPTPVPMVRELIFMLLCCG
jgi:hypothetical protein